MILAASPTHHENPKRTALCSMPSLRQARDGRRGCWPVIVRRIIEAGPNEAVPLGALSVVYAMHIGREVPLLFLGPVWPYLYPLGDFEIVDPRLSRYWVFTMRESTLAAARATMEFVFGYPDYVCDREHALALVERQRDAVATFESVRQHMDLEHALPTVELKAQDLGGGWVLCARCSDAWQIENSINELARCPTCRTVQRLPQSR